LSEETSELIFYTCLLGEPCNTPLKPHGFPPSGGMLFNKLTYDEIIGALILFLREVKQNDKVTIKSTLVLSQDYQEKDKKFILKTGLYNIFWNIEEAIDDGFNVYLDNKIKHYYHLHKYHEKNCPHLHGDKECSICDERIKNIDYLFGDINERKRPQACFK